MDSRNIVVRLAGGHKTDSAPGFGNRNQRPFQPSPGLGMHSSMNWPPAVPHSTFAPYPSSALPPGPYHPGSFRPPFPHSHYQSTHGFYAQVGSGEKLQNACGRIWYCDAFIIDKASRFCIWMCP